MSKANPKNGVFRLGEWGTQNRVCTLQLTDCIHYNGCDVRRVESGEAKIKKPKACGTMRRAGNTEKRKSGKRNFGKNKK